MLPDRPSFLLMKYENNREEKYPNLPAKIYFLVSEGLGRAGVIRLCQRCWHFFLARAADFYSK